ncbi:coiled-coil domain-containing protein 113 [Mugil cephalus]|uniref:coiled-coil domain-containing protein 113 n=1 Tax=Mugil cephalus TaxID=48193 RepID=UPI001FB6B6F8|nr:coiled-coil domain-containing protein 113 [Mugil cephalus]
MADDVLMLEEKDSKATQEQKEQLYERIKELKCSNAALLTENDMFEQFISRMDPLDLVSQTGGDGPGAKGAVQGGWRRTSRSTISDRIPLLTLEQKLHVAQREVRETRQDRKKLRQECESIEDNHKASLKEAELRLTEIKMAKNKFERKLLKPMKDDRLEMREPEKVLRYIEDKLMIAQLEKFNLKNQTLKAQEKKLLQQLQQKKETGKAEYKEIYQEYDEPRIDINLDKLQTSSSKVQRVLSSKKDKLKSATMESDKLSSDITKKRQMLAKIEEEIQLVEEERLKAEALNRRLRQQLTDYQAPDITKYMHVKEKHKKLRQSIHTWERKVRVAEMSLKTYSKAWSNQRAALTPANSAVPGTRFEEHQIPGKLPSIDEHNTELL